MGRLKIALIVSLALNVFLGGIVIGNCVLDDDAREHHAELDHDTVLERELGPELYAQYRAVVDEGKSSWRSRHDNRTQLYEDLMVILSADDFDKIAYMKKVNEMRKAKCAATGILDRITDLLDDMTIEQRAAVAADIKLNRKAWGTKSRDRGNDAGETVEDAPESGETTDEALVE